MLSIIILCNCSVPSQLWAASVSHWVKRIARWKSQNRLYFWAVLGVIVISATFCRVFPGCFAGFWVLFYGFLQFQLLFPGSFPALGLDFGCCFRDFCSFSYFFPGLFRLLGWILGAVLGISAVSATFSQIFPAFWLGFGLALEYNHKKSQTCY